MKRILAIVTLLSCAVHAEQPRYKDIIKLESYVRTADVAHFKMAYDAIKNKNGVEKQLLELAQNTKKELADELKVTNNGAINKKKLAMGALQALGVVYCLAQIGYIGYGAIKPLRYHKMFKLETLREPEHIRKSKLIKAIIPAHTLFVPGPFIYYLSYLVTQLYAGPEKAKYITATVAPTLCALSAYGAYKAFTASVANFKHGWNYKGHLETQIKNLDEIIEYIQNEEQL